jgi:hypothetical protein
MGGEDVETLKVPCTYDGDTLTRDH